MDHLNFNTGNYLNQQLDLNDFTDIKIIKEKEDLDMRNHYYNYTDVDIKNIIDEINNHDFLKKEDANQLEFSDKRITDIDDGNIDLKRDAIIYSSEYARESVIFYRCLSTLDPLLHNIFNYLSIKGKYNDEILLFLWAVIKHHTSNIHISLIDKVENLLIELVSTWNEAFSRHWENKESYKENMHDIKINLIDEIKRLYNKTITVDDLNDPHIQQEFAIKENSIDDIKKQWTKCALCWKDCHQEDTNDIKITCFYTHIFHKGCINSYLNKIYKDYKKNNFDTSTSDYKCPACRLPLVTVCGDSIKSIYEKKYWGPLDVYQGEDLERKYLLLKYIESTDQDIFDWRREQLKLNMPIYNAISLSSKTNTLSKIQQKLDPLCNNKHINNSVFANIREPNKFKLSNIDTKLNNTEAHILNHYK
jgi:hypothetical protein